MARGREPREGSNILGSPTADGEYWGETRIVVDRRVGGIRRYCLLAEDEQLPQIPPEVLKCVAFVYPGGGRRPEGTVFFVSVSEHDPEPTKPDDYYWTYAVTASHVVKPLASKGIDIRFNSANGGTIRISTKLAIWRQHPVYDVAVARMRLPDDAVCEPFPLRSAINDDMMRTTGAGPGEDVFLSGLFSHRPGEFGNIPVIRGGIIAALPGEPIQTPDGTWPAYLIEARSTPGMSGCPVFINLSGLRRLVPELGVVAKAFSAHAFGRQAICDGIYLLGVAHGHYYETLPRRNRQKALVDKINTGVALVMSAERIIDLVNQPTEKSFREKDLERRKKTDTRVAPDRSGTS